MNMAYDVRSYCKLEWFNLQSEAARQVQTSRAKARKPVTHAESDFGESLP